MINRIIGERMKMLRKSLDLTQTEFARHIPGKVDYTYIGKIERGKQYPSIKMLERVANCYGVLIGYFFQTNNQSIREVESRIRVRQVIGDWRLRTHAMLLRRSQELDDVVKTVFIDSTKLRR